MRRLEALLQRDGFHLARHHAGKHLEAARLDAEIVPPLAEGRATHLHDRQATTRRTDGGRGCLQSEDTVHDALGVAIVAEVADMVDQDRRRPALPDPAPQAQHFAPVHRRCRGKKPQFQQRVEDQKVRLLLLQKV